jgi:pseudaminic acid synthase
MKTIKIGNRLVGDGHPAYIIAEVSCNHRQDYEIARKTVEAIAASGADAVKLQTCRPEGLTMDCDRDEFVIKGGTPWDGRTLYDLYCETQTPWEWHKPLQDLAGKLGLDFFSSPFDEQAVDFLATLEIPAYKIASFEAVDPALIRAAASKGRPIIISTGISDEQDVIIALEACRSVGNDEVALLQCTSAYPAPISQAHLRQIPELAKRFNCPVGLSDHTEGWLAPVGAVVLGACIIEKHFILDRNLGGPDAGFSMEPTEFGTMVRHVREIESALGKPVLELGGEISKKGKTFARSLFVVSEVQAGEPLTRDNVRSIRPGYGLPPRDFERILGKRAKCHISKGTPLSWDLIESP